MNEIIYLDPDEEITSVIDKLKKSPSSMVSLAIPRGATLSQSIINLKLLRKSAADNDKEISLVSNDRISRNLASQIGITVFSKVSEAEKALPMKKNPPAGGPASSSPAGGIPEGFSNFKVNSYYGNKDEDEEENSEMDHESFDSAQDGRHEPRTDEDEEVENEKRELEDEPEEEDGDEEDEEAPTLKPESRHEAVDKDNAKSYKNRNFNIKRTKKILLGVIISSLVLAFALSYLFLPYASANIQVKSDDYSIEKEITIDPNLKSVDQEKLSIPGTIESVERDATQTIKSTGQKKTPTIKASGTIAAYNSWSADPVTFNQGTKFTSNGKSFISTQSVTVPGKANAAAPAGTANVSVEAENAGDDYNIGPSNFVIGGVSAVQQPYIYGKSAAAMAGGVTETTNIVTDNDLKNAVLALEKNVADLAKPDLITKISGDKLKYYDETIMSNIISSSSTKNANDVADSFDYTVKISLSVTAFSFDQLKTLIVKSVENSIGSGKMLINADKAVVTDSLVLNHSDTGVLDIKGGFSGRIGQKISSADIQNLIKNKSVSDAKSQIEKNSSVASATVKIWPKFVSRIPLLKSRIRVTFDYAN